MNEKTPMPEFEPLEIEPLESPLDAAEELEESYHVTLPAFEGPLDLLLHLIRKHKVDVYDIPILLITKQYNEYLDTMQDLNLDVAADYVYMAALLIHIKSKMLLPRDENAEQPLEDPRQELVDRLLEYQRFKAVAESFAELDVVRMGMWARPSVSKPGMDASEIDMSEVSLFELIDAFRSALNRYKEAHPQSIELKRMVHKVSDKMRELYARLREKSPIRLQWFLEGRDRNELIAVFLGMLELVRMGGIAMKQGENFAEILINKTDQEIDDAAFELFDNS
ncbi:MAG: segregation and condensation protein A [Thermoanaerobaculia bacterium]